MKEHIKHFKTSLDWDFKNNEASRWEFLKYQIQKFTEGYSTNKVKLISKKISLLENKMKSLEWNLNGKETNLQHNDFKDELNDIFKDMSKWIKIRSPCNWQEFGEKPNKNFLNLEKHWACENILHKVCSSNEDIAICGK